VTAAGSLAAGVGGRSRPARAGSSSVAGWCRLGPGTDVMLEMFCDLANFLREKWAFFSQKQMFLQFWKKLAVV
jgi:hypothetical protein